jgi:hypothetical protein
MFTNQQKMQARRAIANKHGFTPETVTLLDICNVPKNIVIDGGSIEVEVIFKHKAGFGVSEIFSFNPSDLRKMPHMTGKKRNTFASFIRFSSVLIIQIVSDARTTNQRKSEHLVLSN